jgi:hypothetical protein
VIFTNSQTGGVMQPLGFIYINPRTGLPMSEEEAEKWKEAKEQHYQNMLKALNRLKALGDKVQKQSGLKKLGGQIKWWTDKLGQEIFFGAPILP